MARYVALLRGINVAGHNRVAMGDLRWVRLHIAPNSYGGYFDGVYAEQRRSTQHRLLWLPAPVVSEVGTEEGRHEARPVRLYHRMTMLLASIAVAPKPGLKAIMEIVRTS